MDPSLHQINYLYPRGVGSLNIDEYSAVAGSPHRRKENHHHRCEERMAEAICKMAWRSLCINVGGGDDDEGTSEFLMIAQRMTAQSLTTKQYYTTQGVLLMNYLGWQCRVMGQGGDLRDGLALVIWRCWGIMMYIGGTLTLTLFLPCFLSTQGILLYCI